jgi:hypothetical protein
MEAVILNHDEIDPVIWDQFILASPQGMIYSYYHYITAMAPEWKAILVKSKDTIHAVIPLAIERKPMGLTFSRQPVFAQYWGICFRPVEASISKSYDQKKQWIKLIIEKLPVGFHLFSQNFSPAFDYPLPFYWHGFELKVRYTYQIDLLKTEEALWANISENNRRDIRKAQKAGITIQAGQDVATVIRIFKAAKEKEVDHIAAADYDKLQAVVRHYSEHAGSNTLIAYSTEQQPIAGIVFFKFAKTTIYFFGSTDPAYKTSGAMSLIIWEGLLRAQKDTAVFDFEGSMIEPVERFFRGFGAAPVPYLNISRNKLPYLLRKAMDFKNRPKKKQPHP